MKDATAASLLRARAHTLKHYDYGRALVDLCKSAPPVKFAQVEPGIYYYETSANREQRLFDVHKTSPARRKLTVSILPKAANTTELFAGSMYGDFYLIDSEIATLALTDTHRMLVLAATYASRECPVPVRCEYPDLFVKIPDGCKVDDVRTALTAWGRDKIAGPDDIQRVIASVQESIRQHDRHGNLWCVTSTHVTQADHDEARKSLLDRLDFYRWLETHVSPGGVFAT